MLSGNLGQIVVDGTGPISLCPKHVIRHIKDQSIIRELALHSSLKVFIRGATSPHLESGVLLPYTEICTNPLERLSSTNLLLYTSFSNDNIRMLLRSAVENGVQSFHYAIQDFKTTYSKTYVKQLDKPDTNNNTLLWYLAVAKQYECIQELHKYVSKINVNCVNGSYQQTILHYITSTGTLEGLNIALQIGVNTSIKDCLGRTALHYVTLCREETSSVDVAKILIENGTSPSDYDYMRQTCLHFALMKEKYDLVEYLLTLDNVNICTRNKHGYTSLGYLCEQLLSIPDIYIEKNIGNSQKLNRLLSIIDIFVERYPKDELWQAFHIYNDCDPDKTCRRTLEKSLTSENNVKDLFGENLLMRLYSKLLYCKQTNILIKLGTILNIHNDNYCHNDRKLFVQRLLELRLWELGIHYLCDTDGVNLQKVLTYFVAYDPHAVNSSKNTHDLSLVCICLFYALVTLTFSFSFENIVPISSFIKQQKSYYYHLIHTKTTIAEDSVQYPHTLPASNQFNRSLDMSNHQQFPSIPQRLSGKQRDTFTHHATHKKKPSSEEQSPSVDINTINVVRDQKNESSRNLKIIPSLSGGSDITDQIQMLDSTHSIDKKKYYKTIKVPNKIRDSITFSPKCDWYMTNNVMHSQYVTIAHTCLHYAIFNVFSLKQCCRFTIRKLLCTNILQKVSKFYDMLSPQLILYLKYHEILLLYPRTRKKLNLQLVFYLIKRLYNIQNSFEEDMFGNWSMDVKFPSWMKQEEEDIEQNVRDIDERETDEKRDRETRISSVESVTSFESFHVDIPVTQVSLPPEECREQSIVEFTLAKEESNFDTFASLKLSASEISYSLKLDVLEKEKGKIATTDLLPDVPSPKSASVYDDQQSLVTDNEIEDKYDRRDKIITKITARNAEREPVRKTLEDEPSRQPLIQKEKTLRKSLDIALKDLEKDATMIEGLLAKFLKSDEEQMQQDIISTPNTKSER
ncbi:unnamed protein product [Didymodactylos carnosus]|uniref:Uncharacterized protein n=1 Tax=Didymodactylos carnosus TaxID=1234261 RepID=A0A814E028_9BILA|nr:unnamed protein product [Didymodactylos carnosus]CAF3506757.1 unnamed protein product [Didymodactylos carnosus]CAF3737192.1 unnamed protein product [Didymodactylos carnosus]